MPPRVYLSCPFPPELLASATELLQVDSWAGEGPAPRAEVLRQIGDAAGLLVLPGEKVDAELCDAAPQLRVVSTVSVGYDHVDVAELTRRKIALANTPGVLTNATADLAFALLLAVARRLFEAHAAVLDGTWGVWDPGFMLGRELDGATLGIVGMGRIGEAMARRGLAFNMEVLATSRSPRELPGVRFVGLDELLGRCEFVSLHVPLNAETRHLIGRAEFAKMRRDAVLINTARGPVVDQAALVEALRNGTIAAAGLDVAEVEPVPLDDPLLGLPNCLVLPHIGSATVATRVKMAELAIANLVVGALGEQPPHCVNPEVYRVNPEVYG